MLARPAEPVDPQILTPPLSPMTPLRFRFRRAHPKAASPCPAAGTLGLARSMSSARWAGRPAAHVPSSRLDVRWSAAPLNQATSASRPARPAATTSLSPCASRTPTAAHLSTAKKASPGRTKRVSKGVRTGCCLSRLRAVRLLSSGRRNRRSRPADTRFPHQGPTNRRRTGAPATAERGDRPAASRSHGRGPSAAGPRHEGGGAGSAGPGGACRSTCCTAGPCAAATTGGTGDCRRPCRGTIARPTLSPGAT